MRHTLTSRLFSRAIDTVRWLVVVMGVGGLALIPPATQAKINQLTKPSIGQAAPFAGGLEIPRRAVGDPLPRIVCSDGYTAEIYAENLSSPDGLAFSPGGLLYVAEESAGRVRRIEADGSKTTIVSGLDSPEGIAFDDVGNLYVVEDVQNGRLLKIAPDGSQTVLVSGLDAPEGVVWRSDGTIFFTVSNVQLVSDILDVRTEVKSIVPPHAPTTIDYALFAYSFAGITSGPDGSLYVTNEASGTGTDDSVFKITGGSRTIFATNMTSPEGLRFSAGGGFPLYVAEEDSGDGSGRLRKVLSDGSHSPFCTDFETIEDVIVDEAGQIYVSEDSTGLVIRISDGSAPTATPTPTNTVTPTATATNSPTASPTNPVSATATKLYLPLIVKEPAQSR